MALVNSKGSKMGTLTKLRKNLKKQKNIKTKRLTNKIKSFDVDKVKNMVRHEVKNEIKNNIDILKDTQKNKLKNLAFFKTFHPDIYNSFVDFKLDQYTVSLNTKIGQLDVLLNGKSIYNDRPIAEAKECILEFENKFQHGKNLKTITPPFGGYDYPRFFHKSCKSILDKSPLNKDNFDGYTIPDFYPIVIFNGIGSGYQVEMLLEKHDVMNCLIVEPSRELFFCSLYLIDWEEICKNYIGKPEKNIHFIIGPIESEQHLQAYVMRYVSCHCPMYPITTMFINHKNLDLYKRLTKKINEDTNAFVSTWGFYDDEINQINNCIHYIYLDTPVIKPNREELLELPIFILGAGPSLDDKIELIKRYNGKALIISCGTALHTLYKNGIKPDIQFELESHQVTLTSLKSLGDDEWVKSIPVMGPAQLTPMIYQYFEQKVIYFKAESVTSMLFGSDKDSVAKGTPTCTNAALAVFANWGFKRIFMFGMDFGYRDFKRHHASGSIYYDSDDELIKADANVEPSAKISIKAVDGTMIKTKPILFTAMRTAETTAQSYAKFCTFYNCSNGASMLGTTWVEGDELVIHEDDVNSNLRTDFLDWQYNQDTNLVDKSIIPKRLDVLNHNMGELNKYIESELNKIKGNIYSLTSQINIITRFMDKKLRPELPPFYFFLRGSIWHLFYIGYSHALGITDKDKQKKWILEWRDGAIGTMNGMHKHYKSIVLKDYDYETDVWVTRSASDPED